MDDPVDFAEARARLSDRMAHLLLVAHVGLHDENLTTLRPDVQQ